MIVVAALAGVVLLLGLAVAMALLRPFKEAHTDSPTDYGLAFEPLRFDTPNGARLAGWFLPQPESQGRTVVVLHGICSNKSRFIQYGSQLHERGFNVVLLDLRGHGESSRAHTTYGIREQEDVGHAIEMLCQRPDVSPDGLVLVGHSLGGAVALQTLPHPLVKAVVAVSAFSTLPDVLRHRSRQMRVPGWLLLSLAQAAVQLIGRFALTEVSPLATLRATEKPVFLVHGTGDRSVPHSHAVRLAREAPHASLWSVPGRGHLDVREAIGYFDRISAFAHQALMVPSV